MPKESGATYLEPVQLRAVRCNATLLFAALGDFVRLGSLAGQIRGVFLRTYHVDAGVEDAALEVGDLLARVDFAEVADVVQAFVFLGRFLHGWDVQPAVTSCGAIASGKRSEGGVCEEVPVSPLFAIEARAEVHGWVGTPGEDPNVGRQDLVQEMHVR